MGGKKAGGRERRESEGKGKARESKGKRRMGLDSVVDDALQEEQREEWRVFLRVVQDYGIETAVQLFIDPESPDLHPIPCASDIRMASDALARPTMSAISSNANLDAVLDDSAGSNALEVNAWMETLPTSVVGATQRFGCNFCDKKYASVDGVRKHCRIKHPAQLLKIGGPSLYCHHLTSE